MGRGTARSAVEGPGRGCYAPGRSTRLRLVPLPLRLRLTGRTALAAEPSSPNCFQDSAMTPSTHLRTDWTRAEIAALFDRPFLGLIFEAQAVHRAHHAPNQVQLSTLLSIKTG